MTQRYQQWRQRPLSAYLVELEEFQAGGGEMRQSHLHTRDNECGFMLAIPLRLGTNNGIAHVMEHMLLASNTHRGYAHKFFALRAETNTVAMNATTCSRYMALHFTASCIDTFHRLAPEFVKIAVQPRLSEHQLGIEVGLNRTFSDGASRWHDGVVVNEMRGYFSDPLTHLKMHALQALYTAGPKSFNAGGLADDIAAITLPELKSFYKNDFLLQRACAITYGDIAAKEIQRLLAENFHHRRPPSINNAPLSTTIKTVTRQKLHTSQTQPALCSLAILLQSSMDETAALEAALINALLKSSRQLLTRLSIERNIAFVQQPQVAEHEGDYVLLAIAETKDVEALNALLINPITDFIARINDQQLMAMVDSVVGEYLTIGNRKFSPAIDLSLRLWEHLLKNDQDSEGFGDSEIFSRFSRQMQSKLSLKELVKRQILDNPQRVEIFSEPDGASTTASKSQTLVAALGEAEYLANKHATFTSVVESEETPSSERPVEPVDQKGSLYILPGPLLSTSNIHILIPCACINGSIVRNTVMQMQVVQPTLSTSLHTSVAPNGMHTAYLDLSLCCYERKVLPIAEQLVQILDDTNEARHSDLNAPDIKFPESPMHVRLMAQAAKEFSETANVIVGLSPCPDSVDNHNARIPASVCIISNSVGFDQAESAFMHRLASDIRVRNEVAPEFNAVDSPAGFSRLIPGDVSHCARVWKLPDSFGKDPEQDSALYLLAALVTTLYLEPQIRHIGSAYAVAADIRADIGVLGMYSFRDPQPERSQDIFNWAMPEVFSNNFDLQEVDRARQRAAGAISFHGSLAERYFQTYRHWLFGRPDGYNHALLHHIRQMKFDRFMALARQQITDISSGSGTLFGAAKQ